MMEVFAMLHMSVYELIVGSLTPRVWELSSTAY